MADVVLFGSNGAPNLPENLQGFSPTSHPYNSDYQSSYPLPPDPGKRNSSEPSKPGGISATITSLLTILLMLFIALSSLMLYLGALSNNQPMPSIGPLSSEGLMVFFSGWFVVVFSVAIVFIPLLLIILLNGKRVRRVFLSVGIAALGSAVLIALINLLDGFLIGLLSGPWHDLFNTTTALFDGYGWMTFIVLFIIGATCLSVYGCIVAIKDKGANA